MVVDRRLRPEVSGDAWGDVGITWWRRTMTTAGAGGMVELGAALAGVAVV
jgi:hypothetical protein